MTAHQPGIFFEGSHFHHALEYDATAADGDVAGAVAAAAGDLALDGNGDTGAVLGFGPALWQRLAPGHLPMGFAAFQALDGWNGTRAPATQGDIWLWLHGPNHDGVFDAAMAAQQRLGPVARLTLDQPGFTYRDSRDLTGFVDGTANPKGGDALAAALVPGGTPGAGGAFVLTQRWVHDLAAFRALSQDEQEKVIGRTKPDSVELTGGAMPPDSHVSRTEIEENGVELELYRRSFPYGGAAEHGLYFLAFACDISRIQVRLERMFGVTEDGLHDRLIEFSKPVSGAYWLAPDLETLTAVFG